STGRNPNRGICNLHRLSHVYITEFICFLAGSAPVHLASQRIPMLSQRRFSFNERTKCNQPPSTDRQIRSGPGGRRLCAGLCSQSGIEGARYDTEEITGSDDAISKAAV